jgi:hypothetical protein
MAPRVGWVPAVSLPRALATSFALTFAVLVAVTLVFDLMAPMGFGLSDLIRLAFGIYPRIGFG